MHKRVINTPKNAGDLQHTYEIAQKTGNVTLLDSFKFS